MVVDVAAAGRAERERLQVQVHALARRLAAAERGADRRAQSAVGGEGVVRAVVCSASDGVDMELLAYLRRPAVRMEFLHRPLVNVLGVRRFEGQLSPSPPKLPPTDQPTD